VICPPSQISGPVQGGWRGLGMLHKGKGREERCFQDVGTISEGKMPLGRLGHSWKDDIKIHLKDVGLGGCELNSYGSGQGPVTGCCVYISEP
jgi:hypothetical protein